MTRNYSNKLSGYVHENGGRAILLFLLFILAIYEFVHSGLNTFALVCLSPILVIVVFMHGKLSAIRANPATAAYEESGIDPKDIGMIEAHGTGTGAGDRVEVEALKEVYGVSETNRPWCALGSVKSQIGHTKAAAGSANIIKAAIVGLLFIICII